MADEVAELKIGPRGRVVIPAAMRKALGLEPGHILVGHVEDGRLVFEPRDTVRWRVQARFTPAVPRDGSLAGELIAERREEARREAAEA